MKAHPLDNKREASSALALTIGGAALLVLGLGGLGANAWVTHARAQNVRAAVVAAGYGEPSVQPIKGDECWRAREGFTWKSARASGSACAGPGAEVRLFPGIARPRL